MTISVTQARLGLLMSPTTALWTGTVASYSTTTFVLAVNTLSGSLSTAYVGLAVYHGSNYIRIKAVDTGAGTLTLAENAETFTATDNLTIYNLRLPLPRYQRIATDGTIYKDYDVAYPGEYDALPPAACCTPAVIVTTTGTSVAVSGSLSAAMSPSGTPLTYAWDAGTGGTVTGTGVSVSIAWSSAGFRYLKLTVTDAHSVAQVRYIPVWVSVSPSTNVTRARCTWRLSGWQAEIAVIVPPTYLSRALVCLYELDTGTIVFSGFMQANNTAYDFERSELTFTASDPWGYLQFLYSYPFILETAASGAATTWEQIRDLTLQRALWVLLRWHSTLPELCNVTFHAVDRTIEGQIFQAGTVRQQAEVCLEAAFWQGRAGHTGDVGIQSNPLYLTTWSGYTPQTITAAQAAGDITIERPANFISEARLAGVYYSSGWQPLIVRAPAHPEDLGTPTELTRLAPVSAAELRIWASRHVALSRVFTYRLSALVDVDPASSVTATLPDSTSVTLEEVTLNHNPATLRFGVDIAGRTYGGAYATADEPQPPAVVIPPPALPPITPPSWTPVPVPVFGSGDVVAFAGYGVVTGTPKIYTTQNYLYTSPTWTEVTGNLSSVTAKVTGLAFAQGGTTPYGLYLGTNTRQLFYCADPLNGSTWVEITAPTGYVFGNRAGYVHVQASPLYNGEVLITGAFDTSGYYFTYGFVYQNGALLRQTFTGHCDTQDCLQWYANGVNLLQVTQNWASGGGSPNFMVTIPSTANLDHADYTGPDFEDAFETCSGYVSGGYWPAWLNSDGGGSVPSKPVLRWTGAVLGVYGGAASTFKHHATPCADYDRESTDTVPAVVINGSHGLQYAQNPLYPTFFGALSNNVTRRLFYTVNEFTTEATVTLPVITNVTWAYQLKLFPGNTTSDVAPFLLLASETSNASNVLALYRYNLTTGVFTDKTGNLTGVNPRMNLSIGYAGPTVLDVFWGLAAG